MNWLSNFVRPKLQALVRKTEVPENLWHKCQVCGQMIFHRELEANLRVCTHCGHHMRIGVKRRLELLFDDGDYQRIELPRSEPDPLKFRDRKRYSGRLRESQAAFSATGGLHAAAFLDETLALQVLREDVGRHNAVDKIAGWLLQGGRYPVRSGVLWVSGRTGAEIVLKAARAGIPVLAAVGAPSSLAIELAGAAAMTLIGFLREGRMNVYAGRERLG